MNFDFEPVPTDCLKQCYHVRSKSGVVFGSIVHQNDGIEYRFETRSLNLVLDVSCLQEIADFIKSLNG